MTFEEYMKKVDQEIQRRVGLSADDLPDWIRTCQECGHKQKDRKPEKEMTDAYRNRKCKRCGSPALDYGSEPTDPDYDWTA